MQRNAFAFLTQAASLLYLTAVAIFGFLGFLVSVRRFEWPWWEVFPLMAVAMALIAGSAVNRSAGPVGTQLRYIFKLQAYGMWQCLLVLLTYSLMAPVLGYSMGVMFGDEKLLALVTLDRWLDWTGIAASLFFVTSFLLTCFRLHELKRRNVSLAALDAGILNVEVAAFPVPPQALRQRLDRQLDAMLSSSSAHSSTLFNTTAPVISRERVKDQAVTRLTWGSKPSRITFHVTGTDAGTSVLRTECDARPMKDWLVTFNSPLEMLKRMAFVRTNVLQPLASEIALSDAVSRQDELRMHALEMQLRILQAQIEPHFLFNTLANVRHLYRSSTEEGEDMLDHLITYLRSVMQELRSDTSTVAQEFDLVLHYLAIMKIRMGERLSYSFSNPASLAQADFPPAMLVSLVENAIKHGLHGHEQGELQISASQVAHELHVAVSDNGPGFSSVQGTGVGLSNIRQRLEALYGDRARLEVGAPAGGGFIATIVVPLAVAPAPALAA